MREYLPEEAVHQLKKIQFSKSWHNVFVSKVKRILNTETGSLENIALENFIFIPAPTLVHHFTSDKDFLSFRSENKNSKDWDYKFLKDPFENNNRRLAVTYLHNRILKPLDINFIIDDSYALYITNEELQRHLDSKVPGLKEYINSLYIPKNFAAKKGATETYS